MPTATRGFASMTAEERKRIARLGGLASRGGGRPRKQRPITRPTTDQLSEKPK